MDISIIIPARYGSSRYKGKPLVKLLGREMILRVADICLKVVKKDKLFIATDDNRIAKKVSENGFNFIMTSKRCLTGTDRVAEASMKIRSDVYINVQGDEPICNPIDLKKLIKLGFSIFATSGTARYLTSNGIKCKKINKVSQGSPHIVEKLNNKNISLVINTTEGKASISDSFSLRRSSLMNKIPYFTTMPAANACVESIDALKKFPIKVRALQDN